MSQHSVRCVADQIAQHLPDLALETQNRTSGAKAFLNSDVSITDSPAMDGKNPTDETKGCNLNRLRRALMETECLVRDFRGATEFLVRTPQILDSGFQSVAGPSQINQVSHCFEGIVDLVRDCRRQSAHRRQL